MSETVIIGRKKAVTTDELLDAIRKYRTRSPSELADKLNVHRMTIYRRLENIPPEQIDAIFKELSETDLKPHLMRWNEFKEIPVIQEWGKKLLTKSRTSPKYAVRMMKGVWRVCVILKRHPDHLTVEECSDLLAKARQGKVRIKSPRGIKDRPLSVDNTRKCMRSFFQLMKRISGKYLTSEGIDAHAVPVDPQKARARLTPEQRQRFMEILEKKVEMNWGGNSGKGVYAIPFVENPILAMAMKTLPYAYYYWGNRKMAVLKSRIEDMQWGDPISVQKLVDKGLHRKGRKIWLKRTTGELLEKMRQLYEAMGKPKEGEWFPFNPNAVVILFKECYEEAEIPEKLYDRMPMHIWRHTACQDMLDATERNWELVAEVLGWESIDTMKKHYGKASEQVIQNGMLKAMGYEIEIEKKDFKF